MTGGFKRNARGVSSKTEGLSGSSKERFTLDVFDAGTTKTALNMTVGDGGLVTVKEPSKIGSVSENLTGLTNVVKARCSEAGIDLMRIGTSLYAKKANGTFATVASGCFTGTKTVIFRLDNAFYATDGDTLHKVTDALVHSVVSPTVPKVFKGIAADTSTAEINEMPNVLTDYVDVQYSVSTRTDSFYVPHSVAVGELISVTQSGGTVYGGTTTFTHTTANARAHVVLGTTISGTITMRFKLSSSAIEGSLSLADFTAARTALFKSDVVVNHAPETSDYETVLGLCGFDKYYYMLGISDPKYITADSVCSCRLGGKATAAANYSDGTLVFTENEVIYLQADGSGVMSENVSFSRRVLKRDFGCDMPHSVAEFDGAIIFGHSKNGIYFFDKFGYTDRDGSCLISAPIDGLFDASNSSALKAASAISTKDAYYISVGDTVYVWNCASALPSGTHETEKKREKYVWTTLDVVDASDFTGVSGGDVYYVERTSGDVYVFDSRAHGTDEEIYSEFVSRPLDLSSPDEKLLADVIVSAKLADDAEVRVYYDGVASKSAYVVEASSLDDAVCSFILRPERHKFRSVAVKIASEAPMTIKEISFDCFKTHK